MQAFVVSAPQLLQTVPSISDEPESGLGRPNCRMGLLNERLASKTTRQSLQPGHGS
jgi:hypothetical protein